MIGACARSGNFQISIVQFDGVERCWSCSRSMRVTRAVPAFTLINFMLVLLTATKSATPFEPAARTTV
jgi:hypothetical protein